MRDDHPLTSCVARSWSSCSLSAAIGIHSNLCVLCSSCEEMANCIVISSDRDDDMKSDSSVLVFTPTKRPPSREVIAEDRYVYNIYYLVGIG